MTTPTLVHVPCAVAPAIAKVGAWAFGAVTGGFTFGMLDHTTAAQFDYVSYKVFLGVGTWTIGIIGRKAGTEGIATLKLDGASKGTFDFYNAGTLEEQRVEVTGVVITTPKLYTLTLAMDSKNASASGYALHPNSVYAIRTGGASDPAVSNDYPNQSLYWPCFLGATRNDGLSFVTGGTTEYWKSYAQVSAQNKYVEWDIWLPAGSYKFGLYYRKNTSHGIATVTLDGVTLGTIDTYNATLQTNQYSEVAFDVPAGGLKKLRIAALTKNASSSGYNLHLILFAVVKV